MNTAKLDWRSIMQEWSSELLTTDLAGRRRTRGTAPSWLGNRPVKPSAHANLEARLALALPPSYRAFLQVSDGWGRLDSRIARLRPAAEVDWFVRENEHWVSAYEPVGGEIDENYLTYPPDGAPSMCGSHVRHLVQISDVDDGVVLLNPQIQSRKGEWETWFFANWLPGAVRHPSFAHFMLAAYRRMRTSAPVTKVQFRIPSLTTPAPRAFIVKTAAQLRPKCKGQSANIDAPTWPELVDRLSDDIDQPGKKLLRMMWGKLTGRAYTTQDADLAMRLSSIFERSNNPEVRSLCISAITDFAPDGPPPPVLRRAYGDPDDGVVLSAIFSYHYFPQPNALSLFRRLLGRDCNPGIKDHAIRKIGQLHDKAAIPVLRKVILDASIAAEQLFCTAGIALSNLSPASLGVLKEAASHADPRIRLGAALGLGLCRHVRAKATLRRLANDPDQSVASQARRYLETTDPR